MAKAKRAPRARPDTWMPLFWGDYHRDTGHLNATQHGFYLLLIGHYWSTGKPLPDDDAQLWRIARADSAAHWKRGREIIAAFFQIAAGFWRHARIERELTEASMRQASAKERAKHAADMRWASSGDARSNAPGMPNAMLEECPPQSQYERHEGSPCRASPDEHQKPPPVAAREEGAMRAPAHDTAAILKALGNSKRATP